MNTVDELAFVSFKDVNWLQTFGLDARNVLDYFALSQFYDRSCNNQVIRMQLQFTASGAADQTTILSKLKSMTGVEYGVAESLPPRLFVIHESYRQAPNQTTLRACYYVLDGSIYKAPNLKTLLKHRILASTVHLRSFLNYASEHLEFSPASSRYSVKTGHDVSANAMRGSEECTDSRIAGQTPSPLDGTPLERIDFAAHVNAIFSAQVQ